MTDRGPAGGLFRHTLSRAETKAEITDRNARAIADAETAHREAKTARLRRARLENEAKQAEVSIPNKERTTKVAKRGRSNPASTGQRLNGGVK